MIDLPVVVLAGGKSVRMGHDKAELVIGDKRMIDCVINRVSNLSQEIYISGPHDYGTGLQTIQDVSSGPRGPVAGIYAAFRYFKSLNGGSGFITVPVDAPSMPLNLIDRLFSENSSRFACGPDRSHPAFAWWRLKDLAIGFRGLDFMQSISLHYMVERLDAKKVVWTSEKPFYNINTPNDVIEYLTLN